jgi:hypothetical protein
MLIRDVSRLLPGFPPFHSGYASDETYNSSLTIKNSAPVMLGKGGPPNVGTTWQDAAPIQSLTLMRVDSAHSPVEAQEARQL